MIPPGTLLNLIFWKLTLPIGSAGSPGEVKWTALKTFINESWFFTVGSWVVMRCNAGGVTTSGTTYPRTEFREMSSDGQAKASWSNTDGLMHSLIGRFKVTRLTKNKPHVCIAQIHDGSDDIIEVRVEGSISGGPTRVLVDLDGEDYGVLDGAYTKGDPFDLIINADSRGIRITYISVKTGFTKTLKISRFGSGWYFKAGCYLQSNTNNKAPWQSDAANDYAEVQIAKNSLHVGHYALAA
jgi:hypothetical protein